MVDTIPVQRGMVRRSCLDRIILEGTCIQLTGVSVGRRPEGFCFYKAGEFVGGSRVSLSSLLPAPPNPTPTGSVLFGFSGAIQAPRETP